jgi:hypothetical protein
MGGYRAVIACLWTVALAGCATKAMAYRLRDVEGWTKDVSCTPTALAGLTGKTPKEIGIVLSVVSTMKCDFRDPTALQRPRC